MRTSIISISIASVLMPSVSLQVLQGEGPAPLLGPGEVVTNLAEFMMDAKMHVDQMNELRKDIMELAGRVRAGGRKARRSRDITP